MDGERFDLVARIIADREASPRNRRQVLRSFVISVATVGATTSDARIVESRRRRTAKRRPASTRPDELVTIQRMEGVQCKSPQLAIDGVCSNPFTGGDQGYKGKFAEACRKHDVCYGTCGLPHATCNERFKADMLAACQKAYGKDKKTKDRRRCKRRAIVYYNGVRAGVALGIWDGVQDEFCCRDWDETCSSLSQCNDSPAGSASCEVVCRPQRTCCLNENWGYCFGHCDCCGNLLCLEASDGNSYCGSPSAAVAAAEKRSAPLEPQRKQGTVRLPVNHRRP